MKRLLTVLLFLTCGSFASAQLNLSVGKSPSLTPSRTTGIFSVDAPSLNTEKLLPSYARENPSGYSYLCRLELAIEEKAPIGVWLKVADRPAWTGDAFSNLQLQFKLFRF